MTRDPQGAAPDTGRDPADTPLLAVLRRFESEGYSGQFDSREGGLVHCYTCGTENPIESCHNGELVRLEGASDPADMLAVVPVRCPNCETLGVLIANYGPESSAADAEVLRSIERSPAGREDGA